MNYSDTEFVKNETAFLEVLIPFSKTWPEIEKLECQTIWADWEEDAGLGIVTRNDVVNVLIRFVNDELSGKEVFHWANALAARETVAHEVGYNDVIANPIFEIAGHKTGTNGLPLIDKNLAQEYINILKTASPEKD